MGKELKSPPQWIIRFLHAICHEELLEAVEGDLFQLFQKHEAQHGRTLASIVYFFNALQFLQPFAFKSPQYYRSIYQTYIRVIFRSFKRKKMITAMNVSGLSMALLVFFCIFAYLSHEVSFDRYHRNADRIYRVTYQFQNESGYDIHWARMNQNWVNELPGTFPSIESLVRFQSFRTRDVKVRQQNFRENFAFAVDKEVFGLFDFEIIEGSQRPLSAAYSVVLTATSTKKYFGEESPIGQTLEITNDLGERQKHTVTGVIKDPPSNTHLPVHLLTSINSATERSGWAYTYILLKEGSSIDSLKAKMPAFLLEHQPLNEGDKITVEFQPLTSLHLESHLSREIVANGDLRNVIIFAFVGLFLILIASANFINLNTIQSLDRVKEFGLRKYLGASKGELKIYFKLEALLLGLLSALLAFAVFILGLDQFEQFIGHTLVFSYGLLVGSLVGLLMLMSIISAFISSLLLSRIDFKQIANWFSFSSRYNDTQKRILLGLQFCMVLMLIASMFIIQRQFNYMSQKNLGYNQKQILVLKNNNREVMRKYETLKSKLEKMSGISNVSAIMEMPSVPVKDQGLVTVLDEPENTISADIQIVDLNSSDVLDLELLAGTGLPPHLVQRDDSLDSILWQNFTTKERAYLINESACKILGYTPTEAVGKQIDWTIGDLSLKHGPITGVIKNYHQERLSELIRPVVMTYEPLWLKHILIKTEGDNAFDLHILIEDFWKEQFPNQPLELSYLDQEVERQYQSEKQQLQLITAFTFMAILIGFMGLYAIIAYSIKVRIKELAIRRVLGSDLLDTAKLLGKEYVILAAVSMCLIFPVTHWIMNNWLSNYAYHVSIDGTGFALSGMMLLLIILFTLIYHTIRLGSINPTLALKSE